MKTRIIANIPSSFDLVNVDAEVEALKEHLPSFARGYDAFLIKQHEGEIVEAWGFCGTVPRLSTLTSRVLPL